MEFVIKYCNENTDAIDSELSKTIAEIMLQFTIEQRIILFTFMEDNIFGDCYDKETFINYFKFTDPETIIKTTEYNITE